MTEITKKKKILPIIIISAVVLAAVVALLIYILAIAVPKQEYKKAIEAGERYLTDLDYDNAVLAYEKAIEINPKGKEGYLGLADAYIGLTEYTKALSTLNTGYTITQDQEIWDKMHEVKKLIEESVFPDEEPTDPELTASSNNPMPASSNNPVPEVDYTVFDDIISTINNGIKNGFKAEDIRKYELNSILTSSDITKSEGIWGYVEMDIDHDDVVDLLILQSVNPDPYENAPDAGWENVICDVYSVKDGELKHPFKGGGGYTRYYLLNNGFIESISSSGGIKASWSFYAREFDWYVMTSYYREPGKDYFTNPDSVEWYWGTDKREIDAGEAMGDIETYESPGRTPLNIIKFDY